MFIYIKTYVDKIQYLKIFIHVTTFIDTLFFIKKNTLKLIRGRRRVILL